MPLKESMLAFNDTNSAREVKGSVELRGLCGDVSLVGEPPTARLADLKIDTSVRKGELTCDAAVEALTGDDSYLLSARITENGRQVAELKGQPFKAADLKRGRIAFTQKWKPEKLWDTHTPKNTYELSLALLDSGGKALDDGLPSGSGSGSSGLTAGTST